MAWSFYNSSGMLLTLMSTDHGALSGLTDDDHTQYALLAGRSGGQSLTGGTASGDDLTLLSTSHATKGTIFLGTASAYDQVNDRLGIGSTTPASPLSVLGSRTVRMAAISGTVTTATDSEGEMLRITASIDGAGENASAFTVAGSFTPSSSITSAYGQRFLPSFTPPTGVTITNALSSQILARTGSDSGAITTLKALDIGPLYGTQKPTSVFGVDIANMGSASITTATGIRIAAQSGATNNYDMSFGRVDLTAAGAYYGRVPVLYNGLLKYLHVFSA